MTRDPMQCYEDLSPYAKSCGDARLVLGFWSFQIMRIALDLNGNFQPTPTSRGEMAISVPWGLVEASTWGADKDPNITIQYGNGGSYNPPIAPNGILQAQVVTESPDSSWQVSVMLVPRQVFRIHGNATIVGVQQQVDLACNYSGATADGNPSFITTSPSDNGDGTLSMFLAVRIPGPPLPLVGQGQ